MSRPDILSQFSQINVLATIGLLEVLHSNSGKRLLEELETFRADFDPYQLDEAEAQSLYDLLKVAQRVIETNHLHPATMSSFPVGTYQAYARVLYELSPWGRFLEKLTTKSLKDTEEREQEILKALSQIRQLITSKIYESESA
jgi:Lon protease-like protein